MSTIALASLMPWASKASPQLESLTFFDSMVQNQDRDSVLRYFDRWRIYLDTGLYLGYDNQVSMFLSNEEKKRQVSYKCSNCLAVTEIGNNRNICGNCEKKKTHYISSLRV